MSVAGGERGWGRQAGGGGRKGCDGGMSYFVKVP